MKLALAGAGIGARDDGGGLGAFGTISGGLESRGGRASGGPACARICVAVSEMIPASVQQATRTEDVMASP